VELPFASDLMFAVGLKAQLCSHWRRTPSLQGERGPPWGEVCECACACTHEKITVQLAMGVIDMHSGKHNREKGAVLCTCGLKSPLSASPSRERTRDSATYA
jgi:hypothetical protein